jgi:hypothetical protein
MDFEIILEELLDIVRQKFRSVHDSPPFRRQSDLWTWSKNFCPAVVKRSDAGCK